MTPGALGELLRHMRKARGLTQTELADRVRARYPHAGTHAGTIGRWEQGISLRDKALFLTALEEAGAKIHVKSGALLIVLGSRNDAE